MDIKAWERLIRFEEMLREWHDVGRKVRLPFGNEYGWDSRYPHRESLLLYVFFEEGGFCCTISTNDKGAQEIDFIFGELLPEIQASRLSRCTRSIDGSWFNRSVISDEELPDLIRLVDVKVKPKKTGGKNA